MANLIASSTTGSSSSSFTLIATDVVNLLLMDAAGPSLDPNARVLIQQQSSGSQWFNVGELNAQAPAKLLYGPGVFRATTFDSTVAYGVDKT